MGGAGSEGRDAASAFAAIRISDLDLDASAANPFWSYLFSGLTQFLNHRGTTMSQSQRSRILVDPAVQWSIAGRILGHWVLFMICMVAIGAMVRIMGSAGQQPFGEAWRAAALAQVPVLGVMFLLLPVFLRDTLKLSNRFAGPMYRLRTALRSMAEHKTVNSINFRSGDFWQEAATDFNTVLGQIDDLKKENEALKAQLEESRQVPV